MASVGFSRLDAVPGAASSPSRAGHYDHGDDVEDHDLVGQSDLHGHGHHGHDDHGHAHAQDLLERGSTAGSSWGGGDEHASVAGRIRAACSRKNLPFIVPWSLVGVLLIVVIALAARPSGHDAHHGSNPPQPPQNMEDTVNVTSMFKTLADLEEIAYKHGGSRAIMTGYNASVDYIVRSIKAVAPTMQVKTQVFTIPVYTDLSPPELAMTYPQKVSYKFGTDFGTLGYDRSGLVTAPITAVPSYGCVDGDFTKFVHGHIAVIRRGVCSFHDKAVAAIKAGAKAVLVYNEGNSPDRTGLFGGTLGSPVSAPVFALTFSLGQHLVSVATQLPNATMHVMANISVSLEYTLNVIADSPIGDPNNVVLIGSHLDSVPAGPGINDDGSGSSSILEVMTRYYQWYIAEPSRASQVVNKVRFCWWGAEEEGLVGSQAYVDWLNATNRAELGRIALNLNFDMLGSPNFYRGIYNGTGAPAAIKSSAQSLTNLFTEYFDNLGLEWDLSDFDGRSDYGPFLGYGIPAGGLDTGAEGVKTPEQRRKYGGLANAWYDPCYHSACDTIENVSPVAMEQMTKAAAYSVRVLATTPDLRQALAQQRRL